MIKKASLIIAVALIALSLIGCDSKEESAVKAAVKRKFQYTASLRDWDNYRTRDLSITKQEMDRYSYGIDLYGWGGRDSATRMVGSVTFEKGSWRVTSSTAVIYRHQVDW